MYTHSSTSGGMSRRMENVSAAWRQVETQCAQMTDVLCKLDQHAPASSSSRRSRRSQTNGTSDSSLYALEQRAEQLMEKLEKDVSSLRPLIQYEASNRRKHWEEKEKASRAKVGGLRDDLERAFKRNKSNQRQREELFSSNTTHNRSATAHLHQEADSINNSRSQLDDILENASQSLATLQSQGDLLKATHRGLYSVLNTLGLADSLAKLINNRNTMDKWLVYGGMIFVILFFGLMYWYFRM